MKRTSISRLLTLVTGTLVLVLVTVFAISALDAWRREREAARILSSARISRDIVMVRETLRVELGVIDTTIADPLIASPAKLARLRSLHAQTLEAITFVEREIRQTSNNKIPHALAQRFAVAAATFDRELFPKVMRAVQRPQAQREKQLVYDPQSSVYGILDMVDEHAAILSRDIAAAGPFMSEMIRISDIAWHVRVDAGAERRVYANFIGAPHILSLAEREHFAKVAGRIEAPWQSIEQSVKVPGVPHAIVEAVNEANKNYFGSYARLCAQIVEKLSEGEPVGISGEHWLAISTPALNSVMQVSRAALDAVEVRARRNMAAARGDLSDALLLMILSIGLACLATALVQVQVIAPLRQITQAITNNHEADIDKALALSERGDEIGHFAQALKNFRKGAADRQRLESELLQNQHDKKAAEAASRIKSEFLANMSHELRTPLNAVIGFSELMMSRTFGAMQPRYEEYAKLINDAGSHLLSLVSDILDLAKIEAGRFQADFRVLDITACIEECAALIEHRAQQRKIALKVNLPDAPVQIEADARACKQILINLLSNAVKFSRDGGVITLSLKDTADGVQMSVKDEGVGIPAEVLERIGQPFEQASNNPMLAREGTGLGLSVVKALVSEHGGDMTVESREHAGTTITISLPRRQQPKVAQAA